MQEIIRLTVKFYEKYTYHNNYFGFNVGGPIFI